MRRLLLFAVAVLAFVGCDNLFEEEKVFALSDNLEIADRVYANIDDEQTRTYVENGTTLCWNSGDAISVFQPQISNIHYIFEGETGDKGGSFAVADGASYPQGVTLSARYALYPYSSSNSISTSGEITTLLPAVQHYEKNSFGVGANTMVAVTSSVQDKEFYFKNAVGYLKLKLYGANTTVGSITIEGNNDEKLSGSTRVLATYGATPVTTMNNTATKSVTLDCGEGVKLGTTEDTATTFWFALPATTLSKGFTISVMDVDGDIYTKSTTNSVTIERNTIQPMSPIKLSLADGDSTPRFSITPSNLTQHTTDDVVVTINTAGTALASYTGSIYAHTGVLTTASTSDSDWKYVKAEWGTNIEACKLTKVRANIYELTLKGGLAAYYGFTSKDTVTHIAFVFRSADGNKKLSDNDILVNIASGELITVEPTPIFNTTTEDVIITLNTTGTAMDGFAGPIYAHTGVLTTKSNGSSDWRYVKADWNENIDACKLKNVGTNLWQLIIVGGPRAFYGVPSNETINNMAFVFRSSDGKKEVKNSGQDILVKVFGSSLDVAITSPENGAIFNVGDRISVDVVQTGASSVTLYRNEAPIYTFTDTQYSYEFTATEGGTIEFMAEATKGTSTKQSSTKITIIGGTESEARPSWAKDGVTVDGSSATFVLYAPGKESVFVLGDWNNYSISSEGQMKRDGDYFWVMIDGLSKNTEYGYQYLIDQSLRVGDPYATKILDPWNDSYVSSTYPNLKRYPSQYTSDIVSTFYMSPEEYNWTITDFDRPHKNTLAIYELLVRDFTSSHSFDAVRGKLDYLETLGINAIELMPINEFDGNLSWGYNPCYYFAVDKYYGTEKALKQLVDECHKRGIAVIVDVVFNHATGAHPWAKMWWDGTNNRTASNNPLFNVSAPHDFSVYHDFKHTHSKVRSYFKDVLTYWLEEYKVDGFRFDLTKGFVQNPGSYDAGGYSSERIGILKDYANAIKAVEPDAYIIFEHFCDQSEENELYTSVGAMCWNNNQLNGYMQSVMGYSTSSSFSDFKSGRINNIETHDEERIAYKAVTYGQSWMKNDWAKISKRLQAAYALHFLTPYPKMMWQFGELGYDVSINANSNGTVVEGEDHRTDSKPIRWDYINNTNRKALYDALSKIISFRTSRDDIYAVDNLSVRKWEVSDGSFGGKHLVLDKVIVVANFSNSATSFDISVPSAGTWRNLITDEVVTLGSTYKVSLSGSDYIILVRD